jgi:SAM-dependent methyltransferase
MNELEQRMARQWAAFGRPMRPWPADSAVMQQQITALAAGSRVVLLGLTPEIIAARYPPRATLVAVDNSEAMVHLLWPARQAPPGAHVVLADWRALPFVPATVELVLGDGCYTLLDHPAGSRTLAREIARVLSLHGRCVLRVFTRPEHNESIERIGDDLARGAIGSVHVLKLRLLAAVHGQRGNYSVLDDAWQAWQALPALSAARGDGPGWRADEVATLASYRGLATRYHLPTVAEFTALNADCGLELVACSRQDYEHAEHCPTFVFARVERTSP